MASDVARLDGVIFAAGFVAGGTVGVLITIALPVEYLFVGLSLAAALAGLVSRTFMALAPVVSAFGAAAFMHLAAEELLVEAHAEDETSPGRIGLLRRLPDLPCAHRTHRLTSAHTDTATPSTPMPTVTSPSVAPRRARWYFRWPGSRTR